MARPPTGLEPIHVAALAERNGWRCERFGESTNGLPLLAWWPADRIPERIVWGAIHGEEAVTMQALHQVLRQCDARDCGAVVVPVLNPDGVLAATRQNARGVDLNRNFPGSDWSPAPSPTFWPTTITRTTEHRTQLSSPGTHGGSEAEVQALLSLIERLEPREAIDLHTPLECVIAFDDVALTLAEQIAGAANLRVVRELESPTPGASARWCLDHGITPVTYELELAPFPQLWHRHASALARCVVTTGRATSRRS